jgi:asparagine synthase (glutamine-hydrolysing)
MDQISLLEGWGVDGLQWPEPVDSPLFAAMVGQFRQIADRTAVVLSGEGSDNLMSCQPLGQLRRLWRSGHRVEAVVDGAKHAVARFTAPDGLRGPLRRIFKSPLPASLKPAFPEWLNPKLVEELSLQERWLNPTPWIRWDEHPQHPKSYGSLFFPQWRYMFERLDPAYTLAAVDVRYPFLDLRLVEYLLAIPALPWFFRKFLLREAMRGRLTQKIRKRPKTPLRRDPVMEALRRRQQPVLSKPSIACQLGRYVRMNAILDSSSEAPSALTESKLRAWRLNSWLLGLQKEQSVSVVLQGAAG